MRTAMRAFFREIVDYAGLFPPAKLPMEVALEVYLRGRQSSPHGWMLGRFVCPTTRLKELETIVKDRADAARLQVAALGQQSPKPGDFLEHIRADIERIDDFRAGLSSDIVIDILETALPKGATIAQMQAQLANVPEDLAEAGLASFLEAPMSASWEDDIANLCQVLHEVRRTQPDSLVGMKLRCGGLTANAFPSDEQVARFLAHCTAAELPWKATAGLHHPRRHWDEALQVWHHGFVNVFAAGVFARIHALSEPDIASILADRTGEHVHFDDDYLAWRDWSADTGQIAEARSQAAASFGCCSFDEPCAELAEMGLLDETGLAQ